jgi:signal peptidase I
MSAASTLWSIAKHCRKPEVLALPKIARVACIVAFVSAVLVILSAVTGQLILLPVALIPLMGGLGIRKMRIWSAYGMALYFLGQLFVLVVLTARGPTQGAFVTVTALTCILMILLFFFAGRALTSAGGQRGRVTPWIVISTLFSLPVIFVQAYAVPTASMSDTLLVGDRILAQRVPKITPERGQVILFTDPIDRTQTFVKRIVGVAGDRLRMADKILYLNGVKIDEPYAIHTTTYMDAFRDNLPGEPSQSIALTPGSRRAVREMQSHVANGELVVPEGKYFVLGDSRDNSLDSRYFGFVSSADLVGKRLLIYESDTQSLPEPRRIRWERFFKLL